MPLVFAGIAPHGGECLPEFTTAAPARAARTRAAMAEMGRRLQACQPETVVVANPHGLSAQAVRVGHHHSLRLAGLQPVTVVVANPHGLSAQGALCIPFNERFAGALAEGAVQVTAEFETDVDLALGLGRRAAAAGVPVVALASGAAANLDWGALIPLYWLGRSFEPRPKIVVCTPARDLSYAELEACGVALAEAAGERRVAFIASADQGHAHLPDGPYGYDEMSAVYDRLFREAVAADDLGRLKQIPAEVVERGKMDSLWQALMLHGALQHTPLRGELLSYEVPTYFGMLCAAYTAAP